VVQVADDGEHAPVVVRARRDAELRVDVRDVLDDRPLGEDEPPASAELNQYADAGVRAFLAAYVRA
jgi:hypothetical protein